MKVGLLTHHWPYNFGANLQAASTQRNLEALGHEVLVLNYRIPALTAKYEGMCSPEQMKAHDDFVGKYMTESEVCVNAQQVIDISKASSLDALVAGSDAILRLDPNSEREDLKFPNPFWLLWCEETGIERTGFLAASSMGSNFLTLSKKERQAIGHSLQRHRFIGLRDEWTTRMMRLCDKQLPFEFCPDPVSRFNHVFESEIEEVPCDQPYIVISLYGNTVTEDWKKRFVELAHQQDIQVFALPHPEKLTEGPFDKILDYPMTPLEWYNWIRHSQGYVGVRFHPVMVSIVNQVPFVALDIYETGLRFKNRFLTLAAKPLKRFMRFSSKTFDVTRRAGKQKYCLNTRMYRNTSADEVFRLLREQNNNVEPNSFRTEAAEKYLNALETICHP